MSAQQTISALAEKIDRLEEQKRELLEALKDALRSCRKDFPATNDGMDEFKKAYAIQFDAIAKATNA